MYYDDNLGEWSNVDYDLQLAERECHNWADDTLLTGEELLALYIDYRETAVSPLDFLRWAVDVQGLSNTT